MDELYKKSMPQFFMLIVFSSLVFAWMAMIILESPGVANCADDAVLHDRFLGETLYEKENHCLEFNKNLIDNGWISWAIAGSLYIWPFIVFVRAWLLKKKIKGDWKH